MAKNELCRVTNCKNKITYKGTICGTHKWRMAKHGSFDLPNYKGEPNTYQPFPSLPEGIVKICHIHGELKENEVYNRYYKEKISSRYCKKCALDANIRRRYQGMNSLDCYNELLKSQNNVCAICHKENSQTRNGNIKRFAIDHCHKTSKVRGLLCAECNSLLGYAEDDILLLQSAIDYLKKHQ